MFTTEFDAVVVGAGPNGLSAAIRLQQAGLSVLLVEARATVGGGMRTEAGSLPGFVHDICSAVHPLAINSPYWQTLSLEKFGLEWLFPEIAAAHPFDDGTAALLWHSLERTAEALGVDKENYQSLLSPLVNNWPLIEKNVLGPFRWPAHPRQLLSFARVALPSAMHVAKKFSTPQARALFGGMAAHAIQPLSNTATAAIALVLMIAAHRKGWPLPRGGSQQIANALSACFLSMGGKIETNCRVKTMADLPAAKAVIFDLAPKPLLQIAGHQFSPLYRNQLERFRYGAGAFKIDWAIEGAVPFANEAARRAGTVHLGNSLEEIAWYEKEIWQGKIGPKPFVLLAQPSLVDNSRAPAGMSAVWAYCHVPAGATTDMTDAIEAQVERFAPGFRERILSRQVYTPALLEQYNPNYVGGDINAGVIDISQMFTRPALRLSPYRTSRKGLYLCSASTPPGGGVHGLCGYHAAERVLKDIFGH